MARKQALRKIQQLDSAGSLMDLSLQRSLAAGNRLEKLTKDRIGQHSIRINAANRRLTPSRAVQSYRSPCQAVVKQ